MDLIPIKLNYQVKDLFLSQLPAPHCESTIFPKM